MFETEIEAIRNTVRAKTIGEEDEITLWKIAHAPIHPAIKAYFRAEVEKLLQTERGLEVRSKRFPYSHPSVMSLQRQIDLLLLQNYQFVQEEFDGLLSDAVHFQFNYLCRPQWTLLSFMLENRRTVSVSEVEKKLSYCIDYEYLPSLIRRYFEEKGLAEISYEEFKILLAKIDAEVTSQHTSFELARMPRALFTFVEEGHFLPPNQFGQPTLPINAAIVFFEDKGLDDIKSRLEYERDVHKVLHLSIAELANLIEKARTKNEEAGVPVIAFAGAVPAEPDSPKPQPHVLPPTRPETEYPDHAVPATEFSRTEEESLPQSELPLISRRTEAGSRDFKDMFEPGERKHFTKSIFKRDPDAFDASLDELSDIESWDEATHFLDALFVAHDVDPFSREAVEFTDRIYNLYFPA